MIVIIFVFQFLWTLLKAVLTMLPFFICSLIIGGAWRKHYFIKKAAEERCITINNKKNNCFNRALADAKRLCAEAGVKMRFSYFVPCSRNTFSITTSFKKVRLIAFTPVWFYLVNASFPWRWAFLHSVGHEVGHQFDAPKGKGFKKRTDAEKQCYCWLQEVKNDFYGVQFCKKANAKASRELIMFAVENKVEMYTGDDIAEMQRATSSHPSWAFRVDLLQNHETFNEEVAKKVAIAAGCDVEDAYVKDLIARTLHSANAHK